MYNFPMFQRVDGICELWELPDEIPDDEEELSERSVNREQLSE